VFLKVYNTHETILLPCEELKIYSGKPLLPMCKRHMRHAGPTTCARARAASDDDDNDYEGCFSGMLLMRNKTKFYILKSPSIVLN